MLFSTSDFTTCYVQQVQGKDAVKCSRMYILLCYCVQQRGGSEQKQFVLSLKWMELYLSK